MLLAASYSPVRVTPCFLRLSYAIWQLLRHPGSPVQSKDFRHEKCDLSLRAATMSLKHSTHMPELW